MKKAVQPPHVIPRFFLSAIGYFQLCMFGLIVVLYPVSGASQNSSDQQVPLRFDVSPIVGYRTILSFPTGVHAQEPSPHLVLDARPSYGMAVGVRLNEEDLIEFRWARQNTRVRLEDGSPSSSNKVVLDQFHGDFTHEYILDEWPHWVRPFVMGSIGATRIADTTNVGFTRFSFGLGTGVKVFPTRHLGFRVQGQWLPIVVNPEVRSFICGGGCLVHLSGTLVSQGEVAVGPVFRF
jgi:hypothetical protein